MSFINVRIINLEINDHVIQMTLDQAHQLRDELNQLLPLPDLDLRERDYHEKGPDINIPFQHPFFKNGHVSDSTTSHT